MNKTLALAGLGLLACPTAVRAQEQSLETVVRAQTAALERQEARIRALEQQIAAMSSSQVAASPRSAPTSAATSASSTPGIAPMRVANAQGAPASSQSRADRLRALPAGNAALRPPPDPLTAPSPSGASDLADEEFDWRKGLPQITSADGRFAFRLRGRALFDASTTFGSRFDARNITGTEARSVRLGVEGRAGDHIAYQVEADYADNQLALRGAYLALSDKWGANTYELSLGNRLTDRSFDGASSSDSLPLLERSAAALATAPRKGSFGLGAMVRVFAPTWHAAIQLDGNEASGNGSVDDSATLTGRVHWNPWRSQDAIIHLGAWGYREWFSSGLASAALTTRVGGRFNDLITVQAASLASPDHGQAFGLEAGGTWRSFWMFGEYGERDVYARDLVGGRHVGVSAGSIATGYYLTGEKAPYVARGGTWSKPRVLHPVVDGGSGAVEIAARYDQLSYSGPLGGDGWSATVGVNWYLLDWVRLSLDGIHWRTDNRAGAFVGGDTGNTLYSRVQVSF